VTAEELRDYAAALILEHAQEVEYLTIHEMAETHVAGGEISDDDARKVASLIHQATVSVWWPEFPGRRYSSLDEEAADAGPTG
jgi:hypothetical protein